MSHILLILWITFSSALIMRRQDHLEAKLDAILKRLDKEERK